MQFDQLCNFVTEIKVRPFQRVRKICSQKFKVTDSR